jgi:hypothetical protein
MKAIIVISPPQSGQSSVPPHKLVHEVFYDIQCAFLVIGRKAQCLHEKATNRSGSQPSSKKTDSTIDKWCCSLKLDCESLEKFLKELSLFLLTSVMGRLLGSMIMEGGNEK